MATSSKMATLKVPLTITYRHAGTQPPIFVAGEFSDPHWDPQEMDFTTDEDGEHTFKKQVFATAGSKVQYKFRVGTGDWWVLNEDAPTAMDAGGFLNNIAEVPAAKEPSTPAADDETTELIASNDASEAENQKNGEPTSTKEGGLQAPEVPSLANAAKELRHRVDPHAGSGTSTPTMAKTAAEVADSAALLDKDDEGPTIANVAKGALHKLDPRSDSGAETPTMAKTAAEVADSAELLDKDDGEQPAERSTVVPTIAHAAKELMHRVDPRSESETSTPGVAETAAEVANSAALLDKEDTEPTVADAAKELMHSVDPRPTIAKTAAEVADSAQLLDKDGKEPTVANAAKELMHRIDPRSGSGASTPSFVNTAAEVADSAALLDKEEDDSEVSNEEAARTGYRRLSETPIPEIADTAAEVADTAKTLDSEASHHDLLETSGIVGSQSIPQFEVQPAEYDDMDPYGFDEIETPAAENKAPLFAHECVGMELCDEDMRGPHDDEHYSAEYEEDRRPSTVYDDEDDIDLNDPTLEKFPSNREEIIDRVRKLEGGLNEDHSDVEGLIPLSPLVGPSGPQNHDLVGDFLVSSPMVSSPIVPRGSRLLSLPRPSLGSVSSDRGSALSLDSISEAEEAVDEDEANGPPIISTPKPRRHPSRDDFKSPTSDDDEGIVMKNGSDKNDSSREVSSGEDSQIPTPGGDGPAKTPAANPLAEDSPVASSAQPEIELGLGSDRSSEQTQESSGQANGNSGRPRIVGQGSEEADHSDIRASDSAKATGVDGGGQSQLRKRTAAPDRVATPVSINEAGRQAAQSGNWIRSFFKMIFVDWIGGFIRRLCGGKQRETLLATAAAAAFAAVAGVAWWKNR